MFASPEVYGNRYTTTIGYLAVALIFIPALLVISRPVGYLSLSLAIGCSAVCLAIAWGNWKKSQSSRPSRAGGKAAAK
jgi:hypothetical protein